MELKDFVKATITQIIDGVVEAQKYAKQHGGRVAPLHISKLGLDGKVHETTLRTEKETPIEFDVAVTTSDGTQTKGGIGITVGAISLGSAGQSKKDNELVSRIKFSIPVVLPSDK